MVEINQELIDKVNEFIQNALKDRGLEWITYKQGAKWLENAGILPDDNPRMLGKPFRDLLKTGKIKGWVKFNGLDNDWVVYRIDIENSWTKRMVR